MIIIKPNMPIIWPNAFWTAIMVGPMVWMARHCAMSSVHRTSTFTVIKTLSKPVCTTSGRCKTRHKKKPPITSRMRNSGPNLHGVRSMSLWHVVTPQATFTTEVIRLTKTTACNAFWTIGYSSAGGSSPIIRSTNRSSNSSPMDIQYAGTHICQMFRLMPLTDTSLKMLMWCGSAGTRDKIPSSCRLITPGRLRTLTKTS
mmetsp:Transcript_41458/g.125272  ORF Transcript_41458/g.125272 Transcript_41458/m.125272 type:complete len:200 (-) Transcript_41458:1594-2193(-)